MQRTMRIVAASCPRTLETAVTARNSAKLLALCFNEMFSSASKGVRILALQPRLYRDSPEITVRATRRQDMSRPGGGRFVQREGACCCLLPAKVCRHRIVSFASIVPSRSVGKYGVDG